MSEYATPVNTSNPALNPRTYWRVSAITLTAVAVLGTTMSIVNEGKFIPGFLNFDWGHNVVHFALAGAAFVFGFAPVSGNLSKMFAILFGAIYLGLGVLGFIVADLVILHLEVGENLVHIVLGAWALTSGLAAKY